MVRWAHGDVALVAGGAVSGDAQPGAGHARAPGVPPQAGAPAREPGIAPHADTRLAGDDAILAGITGPAAILARPDWDGAIDTGQPAGAVTAMMQLPCLAGGAAGLRGAGGGVCCGTGVGGVGDARAGGSGWA